MIAATPSVPSMPPGGEPEAPVLAIERLTVAFQQGKRTVHAVSELSLSVRPREIFAIVGESGAGKSLTALSILRLLPRGARLDGKIWFRGQDLLSLSTAELRQVRGAQISMIYQDPMSALNPVWTIGEQIAETVRKHLKLSRKQAAEKAVEALEIARLPNPRRVARSYPHELSGGMLQRSLIAMALACGPEVLVADEPTTALDVTVQAQILDMILNLRDELGLSIILITHDMGVVAHTADTVAVMYAGRVAESGTVAQVMQRPLHPYTDALLQSIDMRRRRGELAAIPGMPPSIAAIPAGCPFHPRCAQALDVCAAALPELQRRSDGRDLRCLFPLGGSE